MITYTTKTNNKTGEQTKQYLLTQGDSFRFKASAVNGDQSLISEILFKVSRADYCEIFSKSYEWSEDSSAWVLFVESKDTKNWEVTEDYDYITEVEVTFRDGGVDTVEKGVMKVQDEIRKCGGQ